MTMDKRLDAITLALTAKERAILHLRAWKRGEAEDWRAAHLTSPDQEAEYSRLIELVGHVDGIFVAVLTMVQHWIFEAEIQLAWWDTIRLQEARVAVMRKTLKNAGVGVVEGPRRIRANVLRLEPLPVVSFRS